MRHGKSSKRHCQPLTLHVQVRHGDCGWLRHWLPAMPSREGAVAHAWWHHCVRLLMQLQLAATHAAAAACRHAAVRVAVLNEGAGQAPTSIGWPCHGAGNVRQHAGGAVHIIIRHDALIRLICAWSVVQAHSQRLTELAAGHG